MNSIKNIYAGFVFTLLGLMIGLTLMPASLYGVQDQRPGKDSRTTLELVRNGGCEAPLVDGEIPEWVEVVGNRWTQRDSSPDPYEGQHYFFAGISTQAELRQDVELADYVDLIDTGNHLFEFSAYVQSWPQSPSDISRIVLEYLDQDKTEILGSYDSGDYFITDAWVLVSHNLVAPIGTRYIRIRLISTRREGSNNDGYYDAVSLRTGFASPQAVAGLSLSITGADLTLAWAAVVQDTAGNPITISEYRIYADDQPYFVCDPNSLVGTVNEPQIDFPGWAGSADKKFFKVISVMD